MKTKSRPIYRTRKIAIDVAQNDSVDIKCGGPSVLGFDFVVEAKTPAFWRKVIEKGRVKHKEKYGKDYPFFNVYINFPKDSLDAPTWTEESIIKEIENYHEV